MNIKIKGLLILALISVCTFAQAQLTDYSIFVTLVAAVWM